MKDFIGCLLLFILVMLELYHERKDKKRKEHEEFIYYRRKQLQNMALQFRDDCQAITQETFASYTNILLRKSYRHTPDYITYSFLSNHKEKIKSLKAENIANLNTKSLPNYLIDEFETNISDIAATFLDIADFMRYQIEEAKEENK